MARGPDGIKIIYESNKNNPQSWYFQGQQDARMKIRGLGGAISQNTDGSSYSFSQNNDVFFSIETNDKSGIVSVNQSVSSAKGFMRNIRDWSSVEMHGYFYVNPDNTLDSPITFSCHTSDPYAAKPNQCLGIGYHFQLFKTGIARFAKALWYPSGYLYTPKRSLLTDIGGRWIGIKFICVVLGLHKVKLEVYVDEGNITNNWQPLDSLTDNGGWGGQGLSLDQEQMTYNACGGASDQVLDFGGPNVIYSWRNFPQGLSFKNLACREVGPKASRTDPPVQKGSGLGSQSLKFGVQPEQDSQFYPDSENFATEDREGT